MRSLYCDVVDSKRLCDHCLVMSQQLSQLKSLAAELEAQVQDYETLNENYEKKETKWNEDR